MAFISALAYKIALLFSRVCRITKVAKLRSGVIEWMWKESWGWHRGIIRCLSPSSILKGIIQTEYSSFCSGWQFGLQNSGTSPAVSALILFPWCSIGISEYR